MLSSVNYSRAAAALLENGLIEIDRFKCPAWPDAIAEARQFHEVYVHLPLRVGTGNGDATNTETGGMPDWGAIERMMLETDTPSVNLHLATLVDDFPDISIDSEEPQDKDLVSEALIKDVETVVRRFGSDRVVVENVYHGNAEHPRAVYLPDVISLVIEETRAGFLFDISHARLAADHLGVDSKEYMSTLPLTAIRELHVTGIQRFEGSLIDIAKRAGFDPELIEQYRGRKVDHLPMTQKDWDFLAWALNQISQGVWGEPWTVTFEYGGIGGQFAAITNG
ncbi:MAG: DUF692 family multinuclear iron-containing protein, partial [Candidatus Promineifilaceae bacterium]